jgi:hypothetical protein
MRTALNKLGDNAGAKAALNAVMHALTSSGSTADDRQAAAGAGADQPEAEPRRANARTSARRGEATAAAAAAANETVRK